MLCKQSVGRFSYTLCVHTSKKNVKANITPEFKRFGNSKFLSKNCQGEFLAGGSRG